MPIVPGIEDDYYNRLKAMLTSQLPKARRYWDCPTGPWAAPGSKGVFKQVEPRAQFLSYPSYPGYTPNQKEITEASIKLLREFGRTCGFANAAELTAALFKQFGVRDVPFDADAALNQMEKAASSYRVTAELQFAHFSLSSPSIKSGGLILISVPDRLVFDRLRTFSCGPGGKTRLPDYAYNHSEVSLTIRSATPSSHLLRRMKLEERLKEQQEAIEAARKKIAELNKEIEEMGPEPAEGEGD